MAQKSVNSDKMLNLGYRVSVVDAGLHTVAIMHLT